MKRVLAGLGVLLGCGLAAVPALGQSPPAAAPPTGTCPATSAGTIAGFSVSTLAAGVRYEIASPGLLPVGDPQEGEVFETDVPFVRSNSGGGPLVDSLASPIYPGDTAAHLGTALATFGAPPFVPNYPVVADAAYPPSPGHSGNESFDDQGGTTAQGAAGSATAAATGSTAQATMSSTLVGSGAQTFGAGSLTTASSSDILSGCVDGTADSSTGAVTIAGLIKIADIHGHAAASSDAVKGSPAATLNIGEVTVGGLPAYIDQAGVHLATQQPVGNGVVATVESTLQRTLAADQMSVTVIGPTTTTKGGEATANSGAVIVTITHQVPGIGSPPAGTPPFPVVYTLAYGNAQVKVAATPLLAAPSQPVVTPVSTPLFVPPVTSGGSSPPLSGGGPVAPPVTDTTPPATAPSIAGQPQLAASTPSPPPRGSPVPIGWVILGVAGSIIAVGPLLGYARWQLLEGRI